jgi:hypothetical protein
MAELHLHFPLCLHGIVLNQLSTGTILPLHDKHVNCVNWIICMSVTDGRLKENISVCPVTYYAVPKCLVLRNLFANLFSANLKASLHMGVIYMIHRFFHCILDEEYIVITCNECGSALHPLKSTLFLLQLPHLNTKTGI